MKLRVQTQQKIARPVGAVFEAWVDPKQMSKYFITTGSGRMAQGKTLTWTWADANAQAAIDVLRLEKNRRLTFSWKATGMPATVDVKFEKAGRHTLVKVTEGTWSGPKAAARLAQQTGGWVHMLLCLKAWLEHGINLRK